MLRWRLSLGALLIPALAWLFWLDMGVVAKPGSILFPLSVLVTLLASGEFIRLTTFSDLRPRPVVVYCGSLLIVLASGIPSLYLNPPLDCPLSYLGIALMAYIVSCILAIVAEIIFYKQEPNVIPSLALSVLGVFYIGMLIGVITLLRFVSDDQWKSLPLISLILTVKMGDIGAYTVGRLVGKHRFAPQLSPGKTMEGVVGGLFFSVGAAFFAFRVLPDWIHIDPLLFSWWQIFTYGILVGAAGILGDLSESLIKRNAGRKDSSGWLLGFGGVLDLIDSLLLAGPISYIFWLLALK